MTDGIDDDGRNRKAITGKNLWILIIAIGDCCVCKVALTSLFARVFSLYPCSRCAVCADDSGSGSHC